MPRVKAQLTKEEQEQARQARLEYRRAYYKAHPEKQKEYTDRYFLKKYRESRGGNADT